MKVYDVFRVFLKPLITLWYPMAGRPQLVGGNTLDHHDIGASPVPGVDLKGYDSFCVFLKKTDNPLVQATGGWCEHVRPPD